MPLVFDALYLNPLLSHITLFSCQPRDSWQLPGQGFISLMLQLLLASRLLLVLNLVGLVMQQVRTLLLSTMNADKTVTAAFDDDPSIPFKTLSLSASPSSYGAVSGAGSYAPGTQISLTATPVAGAKFKGWSGDATATTNPLSVTLNDDMTIAAEFEPDTSTTSCFNLTRVLPTTDLVWSRHVCSRFSSSYPLRLKLELFSLDGGSATGADNPLTITMDAAKTVIANFIQDPASSSFALTLSADPGSLGSVSGGGVYKSGTTATITAVPSAGSSFLGWKGDATGTDNPLSVHGCQVHHRRIRRRT